MSVRPSIFLYAKTLKTSGKPGRQCQRLFQWPSTSYCHQRSGASRLAGTDPSNSDTAVCVWGGGVCGLVRAGALARVRSRGCVRAGAFARVRLRGCVRTHVHACIRSCKRACMRACARACIMCLQYTIIIFDPG